MFNPIIKFILILLLIFTPIPFGSVEVWAFSLMELGILLIFTLWGIQSAIVSRQSSVRFHASTHPRVDPSAHLPVYAALSLFLLLILLQMFPLPQEILKVISPNTYAFRQALSFESSTLSFQLSFVPFATKIEFFKWLTLSGIFFFLLSWRNMNREAIHLILIIMFVGIAESLYGMLEFLSGHRHILNLDMTALVSSVTGTFINRNCFAGYLLMVIPLSVGYFFSRETFQRSRFTGWRQWVSSLDGKTVIIAFGIIVMILGLLLSASRMGIMSLLLSFSLLSFLFREPQKGQRFSRATVLIFGLALLWATWIGLDAVVSRFFSVSGDFEERWDIWVNTFQVFRDFPLFGTGLGTFIHVFPRYRSFHVRGLFTHAENDFLQLLSEVGLVGLGLLLLAIVFLFFRAVSAIRSLHPRDSNKYIGMGGMAGILALMFHSLVERNVQIPANAFLFAFISALILRISIGNKQGGLATGDRQYER